MKDQILKIAKVKSEKEFYKKYPSEEAFMKAHGKAFKKADMGTKMVQTQLKQLTDFGNPPIAQNGAGIIPFDDARNKAQATILGITPEELMKRRDAEAAQANQSSGGGANDIMGQLASFITPEMIAGLAAKNGYSLSKAYGGDVLDASYIPMDRKTLAAPDMSALNKKLSNPAFQKQAITNVENIKPKAGLDFKGAGMSALSALPQLIGNVQAIGERKKQKKELKKGVDVSDLVRRAAESRPIYQPNQQISKPWDVPIQPGELYNSYGSNTNFLTAQNGKTIDSTGIYTRRMLSNMDMADRSSGELKNIFTKEWEKNAADLERYKQKTKKQKGKAQYGDMIGGNPTEIQNTYAPTGDLYQDLGYESLNESDVKQYQNGGRAKRAQFGIDMLAGPAGSLGSGLGSSLAGGGFKGSPEGNIGSSVGAIAGQLLIPIPGVGALIGGALGGAIGGFIGGDEQRQMEELENKYSDNLDLAAGQSVIQGMDQQFGGSRRDGGWVSHDWQPQVIAKFGEYNVKDLLKPPYDADMLRAGGSVGSGYYTPPSERAMQTYEYGGQMAMGGDLQVHQGKADTISYNPFLPNGGETVMFKGPSHANGGMDISYGQNGVEVEGGEPGIVLKDGGNIEKDESLVIYGNIKFDKTGAEQLGDPDAEGQKIKNYMNDLSKFENKQSKRREKGLKLIDETDLLKMGTVQAIDLGTTMNFKTAAQRKIDGAAIQEAYNKTAKEYGYADAGKFIDDVRKGSVKQLEPIDDSETAQSGIKAPLFGRMLGVQDRPAYYNEVLQNQLMNAGMPSKDPEVTPFTKANMLAKGFKDSTNKPVITAASSAKTKASSAKPKASSKTKTTASVSADVTAALNAMTAKGKGLAQIRRDAIGTYGQVPGAMSLPNSASVVPLNSTDLTDSTGATAKNDKWKNILGAVSSVVPYLRPSNAQLLDPSQLSGEMLALASNQLEGVQAQSFQPMLDQPYDISLQDQINMIDSQTNAAIRALGNDPSAQSQIMANAIEAKNRVLGEEFRMNQANKAGIYSKNRDLINQSKLTNLQIFDKQYERQSQAKSNTKAQAIGALNSINSKIAQNKLENKQLGVYENLYGYRFGSNGQAYNVNAPAQFNTEGSLMASNRTGQTTTDASGNKLLPVYNKDGSIKGYTVATANNGAKIKARNSSIVKAVKSL